MTIYKISKTASAKHFGSYYNDKGVALSAKQIAGYEYHLYRKQSASSLKWEKIV